MACRYTFKGKEYSEEEFIGVLLKTSPSEASKYIPDVNDTPNAPFKTSWPLLSMKRMIRYAAENGFDSIAWTTGEQQAERYDLSKQVDVLRVRRKEDGTYSINANLVDQAGLQVLEESATEDRLADIVGKDLADKIKAQEGNAVVSYQGEDLKVGGEGMRNFYDKILPKTVNKYVKKWGGKTGRVSLGAESTEYEITPGREWVVVDETGKPMVEFADKHGADEYVDKFSKPGDPLRIVQASSFAPEVHSLPITDEMRKVAMRGQELFQSAQRQLGLYSPVEQAVLDMPLPAWKKKTKQTLSEDEQARLNSLEGRNFTSSKDPEYIEYHELLAKKAKGVPTARGTDIWQKINSTGGIKKEELHWLGLQEFLETRDTFTREQVVDYIRGNGVVLEEIVADQLPEESEMTWEESTYDDPEAWAGRTEDLMYEYDNGEDVDFFDLNEWAEDNIERIAKLFVDGAPEDVKPKYDQAIEDGDIDLLREAVEESGYGEGLDYDIRNEARDDAKQAADDNAKKEYYYDPYEVHYSPATDLYIFGNSNTGYSIRARDLTWRSTIADAEEIWSIEEARIQARDYAINNGLIRSEEDVDIAKWSEYIISGGENYREIKITLPEHPEEFEYGSHFDDANIVTFLRVTDRELPLEAGGERVNTYHIDGMQSDWASEARKRGVTTGLVDPGELEQEADEIWTELKKAVLAEVPKEWMPSGKLVDLGFTVQTNSFDAVLEQLLDNNNDLQETAGAYLRDERGTPYDNIHEVIKKSGKLDEFLEKKRAHDDLMKRAEAERYGAPDAPFIHKDAWHGLALKRAIIDAVEKGYDAISWNDSASLNEIWSEHYDYRSQYDRKMPSVIKKLTKQKAQHIGHDGKKIQTKETMFETAKARLDKVGSVFEIPGTMEWLEVNEAGHITHKSPSGDIENYTNVERAFEVIEITPPKQPGYWAIPITSDMREMVMEKGLPMFQRGGKKETVARGSTQFFNEETVINLFKSRNASTFLHESGHVFLDMMQRMAARADAPDKLKAEWRRIEKALGLDPDQKIETVHHEKWARSFEAYLMEGKAPSVELRGAFASFRSWLKSIYESIKKLVGTDELNPEIRGIFDRMLATQDQLEEAQKQDLKPIFRTAAQMGVNEVEHDKYEEAARKVREQAEEDIDIAAAKEAMREREQVWKERKAVVQKEVELEVNQRPEFRVKHFLMTGQLFPGDPLEGIDPIKLDREAVMSMYEGNDFKHQLSRLPQGKYSVMTKEGGLDPDAVAEMFGFTSGDTMIRAMVEAGNRKDVIKDETERRMSEEFGDLRRDKDLAAKLAVDSLQNDPLSRFLAVELRALTKKAGLKETPAQIIRESAQRIIAEKLVPEAAKESGYLVAYRKAGRMAEKAAAEGDFAAARDFKSQQLLNHYLYMAARDVKIEQAKILRHLKKFKKEGVRKKLLGDGNIHLDQIDAILAKYQLKDETKKDVANRATLREWYDQRLADDVLPNIPEEILSETQKVSYKELTMAGFRDLYDTIRSIEAIAREATSIQVGNEYIDFEQAISELESSAATQKKTGKPIPISPNVEGAVAKAGGLVRDFDASLLRIEQMIAWMDGDKVDGPWRKMLWKPIADAEHARNDLDATYTAKFVEALEGIDKKHHKRLRQKVYVQSMGEEFMVSDLLSMALNTGTESNYFKLVEGFKNMERFASMPGGFSAANIEAALEEHLTEQDWHLVNKIWRLMEEEVQITGETKGMTLFDRLNQLEKDLTGTPIKKVPARKVKTKYGTFEGGYIPIVYNPDLSAREAKYADERLRPQGMRPSTRSGSVNERIETYSAPLLLDLFILPSHIAEVTHDITHRRAVRDVGKIIGDQRVRGMIQESLGKEYEQQFNHWLAHVADDRNIDSTGVRSWLKFFRRARLNVSVAAMAFKYTTVAQQPLGLTQSIDLMREMEGGKLYLAKAVKDVSVAMGGNGVKKVQGLFAEGDIELSPLIAEILEKSGELRHRMNTMDRDMREALAKRMGKSGWHEQMTRIGFKGIAYADMMVSLPTWLGSYRWAVDKGYTEAQAIEWADSRVRLSQGSGSAKDLAAVQRGAEYMKWLTMFYSYFSVYYARVRDSGRQTKSIKDVPDLVVRHWWLTVIPAIFSELLSGRGPDEDEEWEDWAARKVVLYPFMGIPVVRDFVSGIESGYGYSLTPLDQVGEIGVRTSRKVIKSFEEGEDLELESISRDAIKTAGYFVGLPAGQITIMFDHLTDVMNDDTDFNPWYLLVREPKK